MIDRISKLGGTLSDLDSAYRSLLLPSASSEWDIGRVGTSHDIARRLLGRLSAYLRSGTLDEKSSRSFVQWLLKECHSGASSQSASPKQRPSKKEKIGKSTEPTTRCTRIQCHRQTNVVFERKVSNRLGVHFVWHQACPKPTQRLWEKAAAGLPDGQSLDDSADRADLLAGHLGPRLRDDDRGVGDLVRDFGANRGWGGADHATGRHEPFHHQQHGQGKNACSSWISRRSMD